MAKRTGTGETDKVVHLDGAFANVVTGLGLAGIDKRSGTRTKIWRPFDKRTVENLYATSDVAQRVVGLPPFDMTRKWISFKQGKGRPQTDGLHKANADLQIRDKLCKLFTWGRLYGKAYLIPIIEDAVNDVSKPLDISTIKSVLGFNVLSRWNCIPMEVSQDPLDVNYRKPLYYQLTTGISYSTRTRKATATNTGTIHASRVIPFTPMDLPEDLALHNHQGGSSVMDRLYSKLSNYDQGHDIVSTKLNDFAVVVRKIAGLLDKAASPNGVNLQNMLAEQNMLSSILRERVISTEDEITQLAITFAGVPEVLDRLEKTFLAACDGIPRVLLFGEMPSGGLGNKGDILLEMYYNRIGNDQEILLRPILDFILLMIQMAKDGPTSGKVLPDVEYDFEPLWQQTPVEVATERKLYSETFKAYTEIDPAFGPLVTRSVFGEIGWHHDVTLPDDYEEQQIAKEEEAKLAAEQQALVEQEESDDPADPDQKEDAAHKQYTRGKIIKLPQFPNIEIGLTHQPGDTRNGKQVRTAYGNIRNHVEPRDGMALDIWLGKDLTSPKLFRGNQLKPDGSIEQAKIFVGFNTLADARSAFLRNRPARLVGGMEEINLTDLEQYRRQTV